MGGGITNFLSLCLSDYLSAFYMLPAVYYTQKILFIGNITSQSHSSLSLLLIFHLTVYYNSIFLFQNCQTVMRPVRLLLGLCRSRHIIQVQVFMDTLAAQRPNNLIKQEKV